MSDRDARPNEAPATGRLSPGQLARRCAVDSFAFETTEQLPEDAQAFGQQRAIDAIGFGIGIRDEGYNLFAMGAEGVGRRTLVRRFLDRAAAARPAPSDWCYVFNFKVPHRPVAIALPPGRGVAFKRDMERLVEDVRVGIRPHSKPTSTARAGRKSRASCQRTPGTRDRAVGERARQQKIGLIRTPGGFAFAPLDGDEVMRPEKYQQLSEAGTKGHRSRRSRRCRASSSTSSKACRSGGARRSTSCASWIAR